MNPYIVKLVLSDVKTYRNLSEVKYVNQPNTWLIYDLNNTFSMILFNNYLFEVVTFENDVKLSHDKYITLKDAIEHMDKLNMKSDIA